MKIVWHIKVAIKRFLAIVIIPRALYNVIRIYLYNRKHKGEISIVILLQHIGDIITCEPVSRYIKKETGKKVIWIVLDRFKSILTFFEDVDMVVPVSCVTECVFMMPFFSKLEVHNLHFDPRYCTKYPFALHNRNRQYIYQNYFLYGSILSTFSVVGDLPSIKDRPKLVLKEEDPFLELKKPFVAIHLQSNDVNRDWNIEKWRDLVRHFPEIQFVEIGLTPRLNELNCNSSYCGKLSLIDIAYLINKCSFFIGIESSVAHYANALNKPSLILIGSYNNFESYTPYSCWDDNFKMIRVVGSVKSIPLDRVIEEFKNNFNYC